jgi:hypothetical protein
MVSKDEVRWVRSMDWWTRTNGDRYWFVDKDGNQVGSLAFPLDDEYRSHLIVSAVGSRIPAGVEVEDGL